MGERNDLRWWGEALALAAIATVGVALRLGLLDQGWFGIDQARDVAIALDIVDGRSWPSVGPTMRRVTRLGALYHYFWALPYLVWRDPLAGYWFAACLSVAALMLTWYVARRLWGPTAGVVSAAVGAAHPVWVIDGRICWAPAALPFVAIVLIWLALGTRRVGAVVLGRRRVALIGALLGLAVQLHITMIGWVVGIGLLLLLDRLPLRTITTGVAAAAVVGAPAVWAMIAPVDTAESGLAALPRRASFASVGPRLAAVATLPSRLLAGLGGGSARPLVVAAALVLGMVVAGGLLRLLVAALRRDRGARIVLIPGAVTGLLVLGLPGDAWYYYLDSLLPLWALAAGALVARARGVAGRRLAVTCALGAALLLAAGTGSWLRRVADAGYISVDPAWLTLDGRPGRDAPSAGRVATLAAKRRAGALAATLGDDADAVWRRLHGPAFADATGDNGFWVRFALAHPHSDASGDAPRPVTYDDVHLAFWYADDPTALGLAAAGPAADVGIVRVGPFLAARYRSWIDYASCRAAGTTTTVPIRVTPDPRHYGDGTPILPATVPAHLSCLLRRGADTRDAGGDDERQLVAALGGDGTVTLATDTRESAASRQVSLCVPSRATAEMRLDIERSVDVPADLDLYDVPLGIGCSRPAPVADGPEG